MSDVQTLEQAEQDDLIQISAFYLEDTLCGINIKDVQEVSEDLDFTKVPLSPEYVIGIMNLRGQIVTIANVSMKIGMPPSVIGPKSRIIIVKSGEEHIGLLVDQVTEVVTVSRKEIAAPPANIKGAQGRYFEGILYTAHNELMALLNVEVVLKDENLGHS